MWNVLVVENVRITAQVKNIIFVRNRNLSKMGPKKTNNRFKIKCLECGVSMDNDYRMKHN